MLNPTTTDAEIYAAWANMLLCSEATQTALNTAGKADCTPLISALSAAMNLAQIELDEIAAELNRRGLQPRRKESPPAGRLSDSIRESMRKFDDACR